MANFAPLKNRFLSLLDQNIDLFGVAGRFVDYGAGSADVGEHIVSGKRMDRGVAYDPSYGESAPSPRVGRHPDLAFTRDVSDVKDEFDYAVLFDVIEHVPDAAGTLQDLHRLVRKDGWLFVTVPYNAREWGRDDEFYGHLRRLSRQGAISLLEQNGWTVLRVLDPTFPTFWMLRRAYLLLSGTSEQILGTDEAASGNDIERSLASSQQSAWDGGKVERGARLAELLPWTLLRRLDLYFESIFLGFELFLVCQRREDAPTCEVCEQSIYSSGRFFDRFSLQVCRYCGSEKVLSNVETKNAPNEREKVRHPIVEKALSFLHRARLRRLRGIQPPEQTILDVRCGSGRMLEALGQRGWRIFGMCSAEPHIRAAESRGVTVLPYELDTDSPQRFGAISLFHVIEHEDDLAETLARLDRMLLPGGYLVLEYPNARSSLKRTFGWRWFGYDPPHHRLVINPVFLADRLGLMNYRLIRESNFSTEYSFFIFIQTITNALLPFQRDSLYRVLRGKGGSAAGWLAAGITAVLGAALLPLFLIFQPIASLRRRGCVVAQTFKKADLAPQ